MKLTLSERALAWAILSLILSGCQLIQSQSAYAYHFPKIPGPSAEQEIRFYKERDQRMPNSPTNKVALAGAYMARAQSTFEPGYFLLAEKAANESLQLLNYRNFAATLVLASVAEARHEFGRALELAKSVYAQDCTNEDAQSMIISCLFETGHLEEADAGSQRLLAAMPSSATLMIRARVLAARGHDVEAEKALGAAIKHEQPQDRKVSARIRSLWGELCLRRGRLAQAGELLEESRRIEPRNPITMLDQGRLAERQGDYQKAEDFYTEGFALSQNPALLTEIARLKDQAGEHEAADKLRTKAEEMLRPELTAGRFGHVRDLARILMDRGRPEDLAEARKLLEGEVTRRADVRTYEALAEACVRVGDYPAAQTALASALQTGIQDPALDYEAAQVARKLGQAQQASQLEAAARQIDPGLKYVPWPTKA